MIRLLEGLFRGIGFGIRFIVKRAKAKSVLNLGCGSNPLRGAVNVDIRKLPEVDVVGDANQLPFKKGAFDSIIVQSPYQWNPLTSDAARVLNPGGTLQVAGHLWNPSIQEMMRMTPDEFLSLGWELMNLGPASDALKFGTPRATTGRPLRNIDQFVELTYRRLP